MKKPRRHHYMPVFLLARFAHTGSGRSARIRCVLRNGGVIDTSVVNVGVEKDFHSEYSMFPDAEGMLSRREAEFAKELNRWQPGLLDRAGSGVAEEMVAQLRLRSREFRELGRSLFSAFVKDGGRVLETAVEQVRPPILLRDNLAQSLMDAIGKNLPVSADDWKRTVDTVVKPMLCTHLNYWAVEGGWSIAQAAVASGFPADLLAGVHTQLIVMQIVNHRRHQVFGPFHWSVAEIAGEELVLGDVGPLCLYGNKRRLCSWRASKLPVQSVFLPIGPRWLLVGSYRQRATIPSSERLNKATFALSREFVVGRQSKSWFAGRTDFGKRANELSPERILGVEVPPASQVVDPLLAAIQTWVTELVERHWAVDSGKACIDSLPVRREDRQSGLQVITRPALLMSSAIDENISEQANDFGGQ